MASLNNIFLVLFLFLNLFELFKPINCDCLSKNERNCNNFNKICCPGLNCKTSVLGTSWCRPYNCVNQGGQCDTSKEWLNCCYGSFCSQLTKKCECLKEGEPCGYFKCCDDLTCMYAGNGKEPSLGTCRKR